MKKEIREQAKFWVVPELCDLKLLSATYINHAFPRHFHETYAIAVQVKGVKEVFCHGATWLSPVGTVTLINPGEVHTGKRADTDDAWSYRCFYPSVSLLQEIALQFEGRSPGVPHFSSLVVFNRSLAQSLMRLHKSLEISGGETLEQQTAFALTIVQLIEQYSKKGLSPKPPGKEPYAVRAAREYIDSHYMTNPSLEEIAAVTRLNSFYLLRVFREKMGLPPHEYLNQIRVNQAMKLLSKGWPIIEVAMETGFTDQSHFTNRFKRQTGITPKQFVEGQFFAR